MTKNILLIILALIWNAFVGAQGKVSVDQMPFAEGSTSNFEVVITYNNIEPNKDATLTFYISDFKTNVPIENAKLELDIAGVDNSKINILPSTDPGIYEVLINFPEIKKYNFLININSGETNDLIAINDVDIGVKEVLTDKGKERKSFLTVIQENLLFIIISLIIVVLIAFVFYKIGKNKRSAVDLSTDSKNI